MKLTLVCILMLMTLSGGSTLFAKDGGKHQRMKSAIKEKILAKFDIDKDGKLSDTEKAAAKEAGKKLREKCRAKIMEKFDTDKDGKLSDSEKAAMKEARKARHAEILKKFDTDGDGKLSDTEKAAAREAHKKTKAEKKDGKTVN